MVACFFSFPAGPKNRRRLKMGQGQTVADRQLKAVSHRAVHFFFYFFLIIHKELGINGFIIFELG